MERNSEDHQSFLFEKNSTAFVIAHLALQEELQTHPAKNKNRNYFYAFTSKSLPLKPTPQILIIKSQGNLKKLLHI